MTENQFDEFFRKKLSDYSSPVPEDMWQRVKPKKDKDRRFLFLLLLLLLITAGTATYFIFESNGNKSSNIASVKKDSNTGRNENKLSNQNNKHESTVTPQNSISEQKENKSSTNDESGSYSSNLSKSTPATKNKFSSANALRYREKPTINDDLANQKQTDSKAQSTGIISGNTINNNPDFSDNKVNQNITENPSAINQDTQKKSLLQKDSSLKLAVTAQSAKKQKNEHAPVINNLFLEMYVSPDVPVSKTSSANPAYLQHKDSTSNMQLSYTVGLRIGALFGEHFTVKTGFQYSRINEKFNYLNNNATRTIPVTVQRTVTDENGNARTFLDTSNLIQVGKDYKLTYNQYKSFDIPVIIGYETSGDRFKAAINTGVILNIKTNYKGDVLDASLSPVDINSANAYKNNTGASFYLGLGLSTKLNNSLQLFTEPYIKYHLSSMTGSYQPFTQKINVGGLSLGLKYNFIK